MNTTYTDAAGAPLAHSVGVSLYTPVESRRENRLAFSETEVDVFGMPRISFDFSYSDRDRAHIAPRPPAAAAHRGAPRPVRPADRVPAAPSRLVAAPDRNRPLRRGRRRHERLRPRRARLGWQNLFVAGTGVVPTPLVANATLTGAITAVRAARALSRLTAPVAL